MRQNADKYMGVLEVFKISKGKTDQTILVLNIFSYYQSYALEIGLWGLFEEN